MIDNRDFQTGKKEPAATQVLTYFFIWLIIWLNDNLIAVLSSPSIIISVNAGTQIKSIPLELQNHGQWQ
jgi:hypothetical protein